MPSFLKSELFFREYFLMFIFSFFDHSVSIVLTISFLFIFKQFPSFHHNHEFFKYFTCFQQFCRKISETRIIDPWSLILDLEHCCLRKRNPFNFPSIFDEFIQIEWSAWLESVKSEIKRDLILGGNHQTGMISPQSWSRHHIRSRSVSSCSSRLFRSSSNPTQNKSPPRRRNSMWATIRCLSSNSSLIRSFHRSPGSHGCRIGRFQRSSSRRHPSSPMWYSNCLRCISRRTHNSGWFRLWSITSSCSPLFTSLETSDLLSSFIDQQMLLEGVGDQH